ncbi:hypothetical protein ETAA8_52990 [Anatilimnocola aggregata]|uniref:Uncharacterized protein n=1 Tax=Anatilimnocola aggregata TaxID=2528021 RepID=A0A517YIX8_9BACT|nr:hypothetical protein [Anatilimnocola aggregata]QDU30180.1 hypothetical protein ETAA8_52990 [Anatilimnocola aggregata]
MIASSESAAFERGIDSLLQLVLPDKAAQVAGFQVDRDLSARIEELAAKSTEGELTPDERAEYAGYVRANKFIAIFQRQARKFLSDPS